MIGWLRKIESALQTAIEGSSVLGRGDVQPLDIARQIQREIERNKRVFINDQTYVAHRLVIHLYAPSPSKVEEYEALFNNAEFQKYLDDYIRSRGYRLLDKIRITVQCHTEPIPQFRKAGCFVEFSWPQVGGDPGEITVQLDPSDDNRILSVQPARSEVSQDAWIEILEGEVYGDVHRVHRREFNIGRGENVLQARTGNVMRVNHLAFARPGPGDVVNRSVSRRHARIVARGGAFVLYDTGSQNGTMVERGASVLLVQRSTPAAAGVELRDGDVLVLGQARLRFQLGSMPMGDGKGGGPRTAHKPGKCDEDAR
jgi:hypothetical protein